MEHLSIIKSARQNYLFEIYLQENHQCKKIMAMKLFAVEPKTQADPDKKAMHDISSVTDNTGLTSVETVVHYNEESKEVKQARRKYKHCKAQVVLGLFEAETVRANSRLAVEKELRIALVGKTGVGKSATANTISGGNNFQSVLCAKAVTQTCQQKKVTRFGKDISIIDTPGIFDAETDQRHIQNEIKRCIHLGAPGLHAILYVMEIGRIRNEDIQTMRTFLKFFGKEMENRVIVVFTHGDQLLKEKQTLSVYLENLADDIKQFLNICNDRTIVFNNNLDKEQGYEQVSHIILMIEQLKISNAFSFYTDGVFKKAEEQIQQREEEIRKEMARDYKEKEQQLELVMASMQERVDTLTKDNEEKVKNLREEAKEYEENVKNLREQAKEYEEKVKNLREQVRMEIKSKESTCTIL